MEWREASYQRIKKSKWNSQRVHKVFNNRKGTQDWDYYHRNTLNETGRIELKAFCMERQKSHTQKNYYNDDNYANEYHNYNNIPMWICNRCTYYNTERNGYCSICQFSFKQSASYNNNKQITKQQSNTNNNNIDFGEYLKPILQQIQNKQDDMNECIQLAISLSLNDIIDENDETKDDFKENNNKINAKIEIKYYPKYIKRGYFVQIEPKTANKTSSYNTYWREMHAFRSMFQQNIKRYARKNHTNAVKRKRKKKNKEQHLHNDNPNFPRGVKDLLSSSRKFWDFIPSIKDVRYALEKQYMAKEFYIRSIATPYTVKRFFKSDGFDHRNVKNLCVVYHGTNSRNDDNIMRIGLVAGGTKGVPVSNGRAYGKGVYCSPNIGTASGYQSGSMFICIARSNVCRKSGSIYVVPNDYDILPIYLASFKYSNGSAQIPVNNRVLLVQHLFRPLNVYDNQKRTVQRKWSAYYKLMKFKNL